MRLISAKLLNVCQFKEFEVSEFPLGITAITGPNGIGKSNFLTTAGYVNLTGDYSRCPNGKAGLLRRDKIAPKQAYCESEWEHNGQRFKVRRNFAGSKDTAVLQIGRSTYRKTNEIQDQLQALLGVTQTVFDHIFVPQWGIFRCLVGSEADRAKDFARLCGTEHCETIWEVIGEQLAADEQHLAATRVDPEVLQRAKQAAVALRDQQQELRTRQQNLARAAPTEEQVQQAKQAVSAYEYWQLIKDKQGKLLAEQKTAAQSLESAANAVTATSSDLEQAQAASKQAQQQLIEATMLQQAIDAWTADMERIRQQLASLTAPVRPTGHSAETADRAGVALEDLQEKLAEVRARRQQCQTALTALDGQAICPTCLQGIDEPDDLVRQLTEEQQHLGSEQQRLEQLITAAKAQATAMRQYQNAAELYTQKQQALVDQRTQLVTRQPVLASGNLVDLQGRAKLATQAKQDAQAAWQSAQQALSEARAIKTAADRALEEYHDQARQAVTPAAYRKAKSLLETSQTTRETLMEIRGELKGLEPQVVAATNHYNGLARQHRQQKPLQSWVAGLQSARNIVHRNNLPRLVHEYYMQQLVNKTNELLADIDDPFHLEVQEGVNLQVRKHDGDTETIVALSGGEKALLAIAYRLAEMSIFAGDLGMLVLDEPTAGLDANRLEKFANALSKLSRVLRARGTQLILVTHELRIASYCDATIQLRS